MDWSSLDLNGHCKKMRPGRLEETKFVSGGCVEEMLESRIEGCSFFCFQISPIYDGDIRKIIFWKSF